MAAIELSNCDDFCVNIPFDLALELTKIYYSGDANKSYKYKDDIMEIYKYFKKELEEGEEDNNEQE